MKIYDAILFFHPFQSIAILPEQMRNIDDGERVRASDIEPLAGLKLAQRLGRAQRRQRTFQPAEIEKNRLAHRPGIG